MEMIFSGDVYRMNWFRPDYEYAKVTCPAALCAEIQHRREGDLLRTEITIRNTGNTPFFTWRTAIGIQFPLEDRYEGSEVCMTRRCHSHIFCGGDISYICALRMGGEAPHLGMVLLEGSLCGYSVERGWQKKGSNDRGCFILHPSPAELQPGETMRIAWIVFPHNGWKDFFRQIPKYRPFVQVDASNYVLFPGETCHIRIRPSFVAERVTVNGIPVKMPGNGEEKQSAGEVYEFCWKNDTGTKREDTLRRNLLSGADPREKIFCVEADGIRTFCRILLQEEPYRLAEARCHFIAEHQQYRGSDQHLRGAYLAYDNEEEHLYYNVRNDFNAGRERAGMGLLMIRYLKKYRDSVLERSLSDYIDFVKRELVNTETGLVTNDYRLNDEYQRLYNYSWYMELFTELYGLRGDPENLRIAFRIAQMYYRKGGFQHYPVELPVFSLCDALKQEALEEMYREAVALFRKHADTIAAYDLAYPPHEVNYEQSIVAPAAWILLQVYQLTGEERYLTAGKRQLDVLALFNGMQPDAYLYETAIRHWDGYWFGKRRMYGDTFPHYWSALTGNCFALYARISGDSDYAAKARASLRGVLPLIFEDGRASCAYVFPEQVNGVRAAFYDCCANDQDWGLYFYLRECCIGA